MPHRVHKTVIAAEANSCQCPPAESDLMNVTLLLAPHRPSSALGQQHERALRLEKQLGRAGRLELKEETRSARQKTLHTLHRDLFLLLRRDVTCDADLELIVRRERNIISGI